MNLRNKSVKGFTLTELIVVIAIIGVLTATLVMSVGAFIRDNRYNDANAKAETLYRALQIKLNQYDSEYHMTTVGASQVEGICGVKRAPTSSDNMLYVGNASDFANLGEGCWFNVSGSPFTGSSVSTFDFTGYDNSFVLENEISSICDKTRLQKNNPSWLAKVDMNTYTVKYVLYTEDRVDLTTLFLDRAATDDNGYYVDYNEQSAAVERTRVGNNIVGCYPVQAMYN